MTALEAFYLELQDLGITFSVEGGDRLTYRAPSGVMTTQMRQRLRDEKPAIVALIQDTGGFLYPLLPDGAIDFERLAAHAPPLLEGDEIPPSFLQSPCARCGQHGKVCRRADGLVLCVCYWTWYATERRQGPIADGAAVAWLGYQQRRSA